MIRLAEVWSNVLRAIRRVKIVEDLVAAIPPAPVDSVHGRTGTVVGVQTDYAEFGLNVPGFAPGTNVITDGNAAYFLTAAGSYLIPLYTTNAGELVSGSLADARVLASNVTQHEAAIDHNALLNYAVGQHRIINDAGTAADELWSASKLSAGFGLVNPLLDAAALDTIDIDVIETGGTAVFQLEADGGGDITFRFASESYVLDCTPAAEVVLTAGTDTAPVLNYIYVTEAASVLTLVASTVGWPATAHAPVTTALIQSAASLAIDGAYKVHAWTDHLASVNGHLAHINKKLRSLPATWLSGAAGADLVVSAPDAYLSSSAGVIYQLHEHAMPALDMQTGDPAFVLNDPTTAYLRITSLASLTQTSDGVAWGTNKYGNLVLWAVVSEKAADCKLYISLPTGTYTNEADAVDDAQAKADYTLPSDFTGTAFLIARYTVRKTGAGWTQSAKVDLRGLLPSTSPGGGATADHGVLAGLADDDHLQYLPVDGSRALTGNLATSGTFDGRDVAADGTKLDGIEALAQVNLDRYWGGGSPFATQAIVAALANATISVEDESSGTGDFSLASNELTIKNAGVYIVSANMSVQKTVANVNCRCQMILYHDVGAGFVNVTRAQCSFSVRVSGTSQSGGFTSVITAVTNSKIKLQIRDTLGSNVNVEATGISLTVVQVG